MLSDVAAGEVSPMRVPHRPAGMRRAGFRRMPAACAAVLLASHGAKAGRPLMIKIHSSLIKGARRSAQAYTAGRAFFFFQGACRCQSPAIMQPIGSIVSTISARPNSAIWARTVAASL